MARDDKDAGKLISVASRVHTSVHVVEPAENSEKPGLTPDGRSLVLHGASHPDARGGEMVNRGVDAQVFRRWHEQQKAANTPLATQVYEVADDYQSDDDIGEFGFEPGLEAVTKSNAAGGGTATADTPRSEPDANQPFRRGQRSAPPVVSEDVNKS